MKLPKDFLQDICERLNSLSEEPGGVTEQDLQSLKTELCGKHSLEKVPTNINILMSLPPTKAEEQKKRLLTKPVRSRSGVSVVAVMTSPKNCPHGRCVYCPGGMNSEFGDVPQSYTGNEPATMRAERASYNPYVQVFNRLEQYVVSGHSPEKVELIIMGGTFPSYEEEYQESFVKRCFKAMNDFGKEFYDEGELDIEGFKQFFELPGDVKDQDRVDRVQEKIRKFEDSETEEGESKGAEMSLKEVQEENEISNIRCVGLTIETRPTSSDKMLEEAKRMLKQGCTRVELGVQSVFDDVLKANGREHTTEEVKESIEVLKDLGFKLNFHMMLGLLGGGGERISLEKDVESLNRVFEEPGYRPDMLKIYPCMVMKGTELYKKYKEGDYTPITTEEAVEVLREAKKSIPEYCRVMRVQRDIPTEYTEAGVDRTNLRQILHQVMETNNEECRCIRCREIKEEEVSETEINVRSYDSSGGREFFISLVEPELDRVVGFCRLRLPDQHLTSEVDEGTAIIRELHVYGASEEIGSEGKTQHRGFGKKLLKKAEEEAKKNRVERLLVISGVGAREYYRKHNYEREGVYMRKYL